MFFFLLFFCITYLSVSIIYIVLICTLYEIVVDKNINLLFIYTVPYNVDVRSTNIMCGENVIITRFTIELLLFQHPELVVLARANANVFFNGGRGIPVYNINSRYKATNP